MGQNRIGALLLLVAYVILPLFALANAGVVLSPEVLAGAAGSTLTWASSWASSSASSSASS